MTDVKLADSSELLLEVFRCTSRQDDLIAKVAFTEHFIEHDFEIVDLSWSIWTKRLPSDASSSRSSMRRCRTNSMNRAPAILS